MEAMRKAWREENGVDLLRSITLPSASYQAMWKKTGAEHTLTHEDNGGMELMNKLNQNIRGGVSCIFQPTGLANNWKVLPPVCEVAPELHEHMRKYGKLPDDAPVQAAIRYTAWASRHGYDLSEETSWLTYVDANSLYPHAMTQPLPSGLYTKCELAPTTEDRVRHVRELAHYYTGNTAYFVEVTFTVPERLHDFLDYAPVATGTIEPEWLSELTRESVGKIRNEKLYPYLGRQHKVLHHIALLKLWLELGIELEDVHYLVEVPQECWMKEYILEIGRKRAASGDEVMKNILKLSINSLYGKCLQDEQKQQNLTPYTVPDKFAKAACRVGSEFHIVTMEPDAFLALTTVRHRKGRVLRAPRALGFTILEYSKAHMLHLHYKVMKANYGDNLRLLMTDTDSLIYQIKCEHDVLEDFLNMPAYFDLSGSLQRLGNRSEDIIQRVKANKGLLGLLKPEEGDNVLVEYVGL